MTARDEKYRHWHLDTWVFKPSGMQMSLEMVNPHIRNVEN
jgi:hypothetical protein